jgi:hypothetical protein
MYRTNTKIIGAINDKNENAGEVWWGQEGRQHG